MSRPLHQLVLGLVAASFVLLGMDGRCEAESGELAFERVAPEVTLQMPVWLEQTKGHEWYAVQQAGTVVRFSTTGGKATTALDIKDRVKSGGERGLLGFALHPKFQKNGHAFVNYTTTAAGKLQTRISRFMSKDAGKTFDPASESVLLTYDQPYSNHNGGQVSFGPDGYLYIGVGDGGAGGDPHNDGQNPNSLLGTILRIDVDAPRKGMKYGIPKDNPFAKEGGRAEIYAWGLRNPWRFSWDSKTRELWVGDVGQNAWEEVDIVQKGKNYGWRQREGRHCFNPKTKCRTKGLVDPVLEYGRDEGQSITGGYVYRGAQKSLQGKYIFGDFVSGRIWAWDLATKKRTLLADTKFNIASFSRDRDGELYLLDYGSGAVFKVGSKKP